jgi:hypothetical protein
LINKILSLVLVTLLITIISLYEYDSKVHSEERAKITEQRKQDICDQLNSFGSEDVISGSIDDLASFGEQCLHNDTNLGLN